MLFGFYLKRDHARGLLWLRKAARGGRSSAATPVGEHFSDDEDRSPHPWRARTWVVNPMLRIVGAFDATTKEHRVILMGTLDPYEPSASQPNMIPGRKTPGDSWPRITR